MATTFGKNHTMKKVMLKIEMVLHIAVMAFLLFHAVQMIVSKMYYPGIILIFLTGIAIAITLFWKRLNITPSNARLACYYLLTPSFIICWIMYTLQDRPLLAQAFLMGAVMFPFFGYISNIKTKKRAA